MKRTAVALCLAVLSGLSVAIRAQDKPGDFDYWLLALSWSPQHCALNAERSPDQCSRPYGFVVHGLWPQHETGWPQNCGKPAWVDDATIRRMMPIMPSRQLILHQWKKHGSCSGLSPEAYFTKVEQTFEQLQIPPEFHGVREYRTVSPRQIEERFMAINKGHSADSIAVICSGRYLAEVRLCLDRSGEPRTCGQDIKDRCSGPAVMRPLRESPLAR